MSITIFEVCRSPEIEKETEGLILSQFFKDQAIDFVLIPTMAFGRTDWLLATNSSNADSVNRPLT